MNRRSYLKQAGVAVAAGLFAGCSGITNSDDSEKTYGTLATSVTDQPTDIDDFESCVVTLQGIWIKPDGAAGTQTMATEATGADSTDGQAYLAQTNETQTNETQTNETETNETQTDTPQTEVTRSGTPLTEVTEQTAGEDDDGRRYIEFSEAQTADLVDLQGSNSQLLEETEVETGSYQFLQLDVSGVEGTLTDGSEASVDTPGNAPLKFNASFDIREGERTQFIADFTPVKRGNGSYLIRPVASGTTVLYGDEEYTGGSDSGTETMASSTSGNQPNTSSSGNGSSNRPN